jgi:nitroreductase
METWDAITARRNVRDFDDRPLPRELLERILGAGRRAPSAQNWQPWDFVVVTDRERPGQHRIRSTGNSTTRLDNALAWQRSALP